MAFPDDSEFIAMKKDGIPFTAAIGNENPGETDIVGTEDYPAVYFVTKDGYAYFRFRLREDPTSGIGFANFAWVILFDTDSDLSNSYEWELALRGNSNDVVLIENTVKNSPSPDWGDTAEGTPISFPITAYDIARAVAADSMLGGVQNYFLDISVELTTLKSMLGISDDTPLRFRYFTAANENNFNKDRMCEGFDECFTDFVSLGTNFSGLVINKEDGSGIAGATVELYSNGTLVNSTTTGTTGYYTFPEPQAGEYNVKITKCCFQTNCYCNTITIENQKNNIYNFALAYDCICTIKCEISDIEALVIAEKERIYEKVAGFFAETEPDDDTLSRYITILCLLDDSTAELDCCISKVLEQLVLCEEGDSNG